MYASLFFQQRLMITSKIVTSSLGSAHSQSNFRNVLGYVLMTELCFKRKFSLRYGLEVFKSSVDQ